jgi:hypothetical protein
VREATLIGGRPFGSTVPNKSSEDLFLAMFFNGFGISLHKFYAPLGSESVTMTMPWIGGQM